VFAQVREKARQTTCASNERELGMGMMLYTQDNDDYFPMMQYGTPGATATTWSTAIYPYIKNGSNDQKGWAIAGGIFMCPSAPRTQYNDYGIRDDVFEDTIYSGNPIYTVSTSQIDAPTDKAMIFDKGLGAGSNNGAQQAVVVEEWYWTDWVGNPVNSNDDGSGWNWQNPNPQKWDLQSNHDCDMPANGTWYWPECDDYPRYRHTNTTNIVFFDGHVKAIRHGQLDWYKNIYLHLSIPTSYNASWYPY